MDAITILKRCRGAEEDLERLRQRLQQRHEILTAIGAPQPDPIGGGRGSGDPDKYGRIMADIDQLERQMQSRQEDYRAEAAAAAALMDLVPDLEGKVLYSYYVRRMSVPAIAKKESYQPGYLRKVKKRGEELLRMLAAETVEALVPGWYLRKRKGEGEKWPERRDG